MPPLADPQGGHTAEGHLLGPQGRQLRGRARRGPRHHRQERRRQEHHPQGPLPHHLPNGGRGRHARSGRLPPGGRHRLSPRTHRPGEHILQRRHSRHEEARDRRQVRRDREVLRRREVPRHAGEALLQRDAGAARLLGGGAPRAGDFAGGRGAGGGGCGVPEEVPREDGGGGEGGEDSAVCES